MANEPARDGGWAGSRWRRAAWAAAGAIVLLPVAAMQVTDEVDWGLGDVVLAGLLVGGVGIALELAARAARGGAYLAGVGVAVVTALALVWTNAALGLIGSEDNPANLLYGGVLAVGLVGAVAARLRPRGMARALVATAAAQALVAAVALIGGVGVAGPVSTLDVLMLTGFFAASWLASAWLFRKAARTPPPAAAGLAG